MGVHEGHRDRMKREFLQGGLRHFSEPRVLELLLFYSRLQGDVNPLAHRLLEAFGSLSGVLDASPADLAKVPGVGENTVVLLKLIPAVAARYLASRTSADVIISDSASLRTLFLPYFFGARNEMSFLACFDGKLKLLGVRLLSEGSPSANEISLRKIATEALALGATAVVLAHSGTVFRAAGAFAALLAAPVLAFPAPFFSATGCTSFCAAGPVRPVLPDFAF